MKTTRITRATRERAESLSKFIYGRITTVCYGRIKEGEEDAQNWIRAIERKYKLTISR